MNVTNEQAVLATDNLMSGVYIPALLQKLASRGYNPQNEAEINHLVDLATKLASRPDLHRPKQASQSRFAGVLAAIDEVPLGGFGSDYEYKQAAVQLAHTPALYESVLVLDAYEKQAAEAAKQPAAAPAA